MSDVKRYYVRGPQWAEAGEATRECDCSWPCVKVVKAEDYDALASRLHSLESLVRELLNDPPPMTGDDTWLSRAAAVVERHTPKEPPPMEQLPGNVTLLLNDRTLGIDQLDAPGGPQPNKPRG